jgi:pSer/pThr/pTyr-binding forkhead associated (FHA) protein
MNISLLMLAARIALIVCLYGFLALVLVTLWRDMRASSAAHPSGPAPFHLLRLREDGTPERSYPLQKDSCFIGRSPSVEVSLADETVSVVHARLWKENGRWWLEDLDSRNGTLLNQIPVAKKSVLCAGDRIRTGRILLEFRLDDSPLPPPEQDSRAKDAPA